MTCASEQRPVVADGGPLVDVHNVCNGGNGQTETAVRFGSVDRVCVRACVRARKMAENKSSARVAARLLTDGIKSAAQPERDDPLGLARTGGDSMRRDFDRGSLVWWLIWSRKKRQNV